MPDSIRVDWTPGSEFLRLVQARTARKTSSYRWFDDLQDPLSEVWAGLKGEFMDGQILEGSEVGLLLTITDRRVSNYFNSPGATPIQQPSLSDFDPTDIEDVKSALDSPYQVAIRQEHLGLIDAKLSEMPPHWAEAVRSLLEYPGAAEWADLARISGTTRQNVAKRAKKGLRKLAPLIADLFPESIRVGRVNPGP
jgi:hypothetical protein